MFTVLIVDDTLFYRSLLKSLLKEMEEFQVTATAGTGDRALELLEKQPVDLVLLDIHMPGLSMLETLDRITADYPETSVVIMSGISNKSTPVTLEGLTRGALDFIQKPDEKDFKTNSAALKLRLKILAEIMDIKKSKSRKSVTSARIKREKKPFRASIVVIGVSTGGPNALKKILSEISPSVPVPILIVQHMPDKFTRSLAKSMDDICALTVKEAEAGERASGGVVYIAPGGKHLKVKKRGTGIIFEINDGPKIQSCKPSVDVLFKSVAGERIQGVCCLILTGMGMDGLEGVKALKNKGALCLTQSKETCVVYGMPRAVNEAGLSDGSIDVKDIHRKIEEVSGAD